MRWYRKVFKEDDPSKQLIIICDACSSYEDYLETCTKNLLVPQGLIVKKAADLAGLAAENESIVKDLEIMLEHIQNMEDRIKTDKTKYYMENYPRKLTESVARQYADVDDEVQVIRMIRFRVADVSNQFMAISKGLSFMHYQLSNIVKLRSVGLEDATF